MRAKASIRQSANLGQRKQAFEAFKQAHPVCCFCAGECETEERDHVPPKAAFFGKVWPEGFEFPACSRCNRRTRFEDQYFAWHLRMFGWPPDWLDSDRANTDRLSEGIRNNQPELIPIAPSKLREIEWLTENRLLGSGYRAVRIKPECILALESTYRKIAVALFYKHVGRPLPKGAGIGSRIKNNLMLEDTSTLIEIMSVMRMPAVPKRGSNDFKGQFIYTHDYNAEQGLFGVSAKFGEAVVGMAVCAERPNELTLEEVLALYLSDGTLLKAKTTTQE